MNVARLVPYALAAIGLGAAANALELRLWTYGEPAAGLFPFLAATLLVVTSLLSTREKVPEEEAIELPRLIGYSAALVGFCLMLNIVGFALAALLFLIAVLTLIERMGWKKGIFLAALFAFSTWGLFEGLLSVPLPQGMWRM